MLSRLCLLSIMLCLGGCGGGLVRYAAYTGDDSAVLLLEAPGVTDGFFSDSGVRVNVFGAPDAQCEYAYHGTLFAKLGDTTQVKIPASEAFYGRVVYEKSNAWMGSNKASWVDFHFTPRTGSRYKVTYTLEDKGYDLVVQETVRSGHTQELAIESWPQCQRIGEGPRTSAHAAGSSRS